MRTNLTGVSSRGFGLKLSDPLVMDIDGNKLTTGIAVGAPETNRAYYVRVRPVVRLVDKTDIKIKPDAIDPLTTTTITLIVRPDITRISAKSVILNIRATYVESKSWKNMSNPVVEESFGDSEIAPSITFELSRSLTRSWPRTDQFRVRLEYFLEDCHGSNCPIFGDGKFSYLASSYNYTTSENHTILSREIEGTTKICEDQTNGCHCRVTFSEKGSNIDIIAGKDGEVRVGDLRNDGSEPSNSTELRIVSHDISLIPVFSAEKHLVRCKERSEDNKTDCTVHSVYLPPRSSNSLSLRISPDKLTPHIQQFTLSLSVSARCSGENSSVFERKLRFNVKHIWFLKLSQNSEQENKEIPWYDPFQGEAVTPEPVRLRYDITNNGPSISTPTSVSVLIPNHALILNPQVKFEDNRTCSKVSPTMPKSSQETEIECENEDCIEFKCDTGSMQKKEKETLIVTFQFDTNGVEAGEAKRYRVRTSVRVSQNEPLTTFTTLQYKPRAPPAFVVEYWHYALGAGAILLVFIIGLVSWKMNLFQRVRVFKKDNDGIIKEVQHSSTQEYEN